MRFIYRYASWLFFCLIIINCSGSRPQRHNPNGDVSAEAIACNNILSAASPWMGTPYKYGGTNRSGVDCSGFVQHIFSSVYGVRLPRTTEKMAQSGSHVRVGWLRCGDLLFFKNIRGGGVDHVGIYVGQNRFVHASSSNGVVVSELDSEYYAAHFTFARRVK